MPPKKRKAGPPATTATQGKRPRIGSGSVAGDDGASMVSTTGRPKRSTAGDPSYDQSRRRSSFSVSAEPKQATTTTSQPKKRGPGRPRKATTNSVSSAATQATTTKKPEGRARTASHVELPVRKRGRPKKEVTSSSESPVTNKATTSVPSSKAAAESPQVKKTSGQRGRPKRVVPAQELVEDSTGAIVQEAEWEEGGPEPEPELDDERQFWLMKAEPESRIQKGIDVKFSIDDLMSKTEPEGWDGVRNAVARNNMRAMREGDLAFFYHSNCPVPGIAGIMQIVQEHSIDESAFDPSHPYYDPKSTDRTKPKWELVHVKGMHRFDNLVTLKELKAHMGPGEPLENLQTLKQSRLSVTSVSPKEWNFIMDLSGEDFEDEEVEQAGNNTSPEDEADTITADANGDVKLDAEEGAGAFDINTDV